MAESRVKDENYYQISGFMINRLGLKGVPLNVYAIIYGFTQDGDNEFTGSLHYLCDFCGGVSKPTIIKALKELVANDYIYRREEYINGVQFNRYKVNLPLLKKLNGGGQNSCGEVVKNFKQGGQNSLTNNISDISSFDNKEDNKNNAQNDFETLWKMYPRKLGKAKAEQAYEKAIKNGVTFEQIRRGIEAYCKQIDVEAAQRAKNQKITLEEAKAAQMQFVKHGSTWFKGEHWNDEYNATPTAKPAKKYNIGGVNL